MVTATFFAPPKADGAEDTRLEDGVAHSEEERARATQQAVALARTPMLTAFDASAEYVYLEQLDPTSAEQWAVLHFESPVRGCPMDTRHRRMPATRRGMRGGTHVTRACTRACRYPVRSLQWASARTSTPRPPRRLAGLPFTA